MTSFGLTMERGLVMDFSPIVWHLENTVIVYQKADSDLNSVGFIVKVMNSLEVFRIICIVLSTFFISTLTVWFYFIIISHLSQQFGQQLALLLCLHRHSSGCAADCLSTSMMISHIVMLYHSAAA